MIVIIMIIPFSVSVILILGATLEVAPLSLVVLPLPLVALPLSLVASPIPLVVSSFSPMKNSK